MESSHENQDEREGRLRCPLTSPKRLIQVLGGIQRHYQIKTDRRTGMKIKTNLKAGSDVKDSHDRYAD
jgi:hypothetical protein